MYQLMNATKFGMCVRRDFNMVPIMVVLTIISVIFGTNSNKKTHRLFSRCVLLYYCRVKV